MTAYAEFLAARAQSAGGHGFDSGDLPDWLFDFQAHLTRWALKMGRAAIFADCGLGKTSMQLVWADRVSQRAGRPVLIVAPLAVSQQIVAEASKFGVTDVARSSDGSLPARVTVTNYERLHLFDPKAVAGMVCDESSVLKNFDGARRQLITDYMRKMPFRLLCTATAAPNDYIELGTSSEALGELGRMDMLMRFFKNDQNSVKANRSFDSDGKWRFKRHAEQPFWRWVCSWARACRTPADLGFDATRFVLPTLTEVRHVIRARVKRPGHLFEVAAHGLAEQREEESRTIVERCEKVAELVKSRDSSLVWCHRNDEGDLLEKLIPGAVQVAGRHSDEDKEERLIAFAEGRTKVLITKPKIGCLGLNLQRCAHVTFFPSHSYEQYYQGVRRCWRFGQSRPVTVDVVATEGQVAVMDNLHRKAEAADRMFSALVANMNQSVQINRQQAAHNKKEQVPSWL